MLKRLPSLLLLIVLFSNPHSQAQTIYSLQDGKWEDSTTWNINQALSDTLDGDTIIINRCINFSHPLLLSNCYIIIDTFGSICGHDTVHLFHSTGYEYGGFYSQYVYLQSSYWFCHQGYFVEINGGILTFYDGPGEWMVCCGCGGHASGDFICSCPVQSWRDTTQTDTVIIPPPMKPISISVYPDPSINQFTINAEIPDSNSHVIADIFDLLGRKIKTISIPDGKSSLTIFTNYWAAGIYLLRFQQGDIIIQTNKIVRVQ